MNTLSHVPSTSSPLQYMTPYLYMPSPCSPITTTVMPALPHCESTSLQGFPQNSINHYSYASNNKLSTTETIKPSPTTVSPIAETFKPEQPTSRSRKRTRATPEQLAVLEKTFSTTPTPSSRLREQLSRDLRMPERSIQIWFQNRRAKVKNMAKRTSAVHCEAIRMQYYAAAAASAACQAAGYRYQQVGAAEKTMATTPDLYYYYYYYYYNQLVQNRQYFASIDAASSNRNVISPFSNFVPQSAPPPPPMIAGMWSAAHPPPPPASFSAHCHYQQGLGEGAPLPMSVKSNSRSLDPHLQPCEASVDMKKTVATVATAAPSAHQELQQRSKCLTPPGIYWPNITQMGQEQQEYPPPVPQPPTPPLDEVLPEVVFPSTTTDQLPAKALQIGTWGRMSLHPYDLTCYYDIQYRTMIWGIQNGPLQFKMEFSFDSVLQMSLQPLPGAQLGLARLELRLARPEAVTFYMKVSSFPTGADYWTQCSDFTQDSQAAKVHVHQLDGPIEKMRAAIQRLVQKDTYLQSVFVECAEAKARWDTNV